MGVQLPGYAVGGSIPRAPGLDGLYCLPQYFFSLRPSAKSPSSRGGESELGKLESSNSRCHSVSLICLIHSITSSASSKNSRLIVSPTARAVLQVDDQLEFSPAGQLEPPILAGEHRSRLGRALGRSNSW
jgi:hypothetical protein